jgi:hypothetical protein
VKAKELIKILEQNPDFEVQFVFSDKSEKFLNLRSFENLELADVGHSSKVILLTGDEVSK